MTGVLRALVAAVVVAGCYSAPTGARPLSAAELEIVRGRWDAWRQAGLDPIGQQCVDELREWRVVEARDDAHMFELTGLCGPFPRHTCADRMQAGECQWGCAFAAQRTYGTGFFLAQDRYPLTVVARGVDPERALRHEAVHELERCTARPSFAPARPHGDAAVWCAEGCPGKWRPR